MVHPADLPRRVHLARAKVSPDLSELLRVEDGAIHANPVGADGTAPAETVSAFNVPLEAGLNGYPPGLRLVKDDDHHELGATRVDYVVSSLVHEIDCAMGVEAIEAAGAVVRREEESVAEESLQSVPEGQVKLGLAFSADGPVLLGGAGRARGACPGLSPPLLRFFPPTGHEFSKFISIFFSESWC